MNFLGSVRSGFHSSDFAIKFLHMASLAIANLCANTTDQVPEFVCDNLTLILDIQSQGATKLLGDAIDARVFTCWFSAVCKYVQL
jgi:hypothetical protein